MSGHTRGPWQVMPEEVGKDYVRVRGTRIGERYKVANVVTPVYPGAPDSEAQETRANAHLIAAAPDLLLALRGLLAAYDESVGTDGGINSDAISIADAAVAKAEGR